MITWILAVLALYFIQIYATALFHLPSVSLLKLAGGRDELPDKGRLGLRADKALLNMKENLPFFLVPAVLAYVLPTTDVAMAVLGAQLFFWGRLVYIPAYLTGIPGPRSIAYTIALVGNIITVAALFST